MKEKLEEIRASIKALLTEAQTLIDANKLDEAKAKHAEVKTLREKAEVIKAQIAEIEQNELEALKTENDTLKAKAAKPIRLPFEGAEPSDPADDGIKAFTSIKYGEASAAVKAIIADLYGNKYNYNEKRENQMAAFAKYVRLGEARLTAAEHELLVPTAKNFILRPEHIESEVKMGRTLAEIKATLEEGSNDLGGYLVPEDYRTEIIKRLVAQTVVRGLARAITTTRDAVEWPRLEGGNTLYTSAVRVTWVDETPTSATAAGTNPTFGLIRIPIHTVMARTDLSRNLLEDSAFNLLDVMSGLFAEAMAIDEDAQFLTGQGSGTPYGVLGNLATGAQAAPVTGVTAVVSGNASQITADGLYDLVYTIASQYRRNAVFVMARLTQRDVRKLKDGNGQYLWQPGLQEGQPPRLLGYPVYESDSMPAIAANAHPIIFGDFRNGYLVADRVGMTVERVTDVTTTGQNTIALFARRRLGGQVVAPWSLAAQLIST